MSKPWRTLAILLFLSALLFGGFWGENLLAVTSEDQSKLREFTELLLVAHEHYGVEVPYRELVYASIHGMLRTLDPHTSFLSPESYDHMRERQQGSFFGLGILVSMRNGLLTVISPIEGTPAWRLGLRAGDVISAIEGEATDTMTLDEAVDKLKGPKDTQVKVNIVRRGLEEPLELTITRAEIPQNTVRYAYMMTPETGYIRLTDFSRSTSNEMHDALEKLKDAGMKRLLLDLRSNGGGLLDQTIAVSDLFVPAASRIVETRGRTSDSYQSFYSDGNHKNLDMPIVVLVNNGTASAAEILAGAIQDHDIGLVVGMPTWGKGLVQTVYNLSYGAGVALTTAKYYTPSGRLIQRDYSSYFDYYTHFENIEESSPVPEVGPGDQPEFNTDLGRKVFGGGGITPDILVELPEGSPALQTFFAKNVFFDFAIEYTASHKVEDQSWQPPASLLEEFRAWLSKEDAVTEEEIASVFGDEEAKNLALQQIHADIFTSAFGTEAAHKVLAKGDTQIQTALELFGKAEELLHSRHELGTTKRDKQLFAASEPAGELKGSGSSRRREP